MDKLGHFVLPIQSTIGWVGEEWREGREEGLENATQHFSDGRKYKGWRARLNIFLTAESERAGERDSTFF